MGSQIYQTCLAAALCASLCGAAPVSESLVVLVSSPVSAHRGQTVTLPCWLSPPQNAEDLEVRWYRGDDHYDSPVMLYQDKTLEHMSQEASYVGRVTFGLKDAASQGLTTGDVSLMLLNVTLEDAGDYTCYVSSDQVYDRASVGLSVTERGTQPLLSPVWQEDNMVNVSCECGGWYPEPSLRWSNQKQVLTPKGLQFSKDSSGLFSVHSWILVSSTSDVSCSVGLPGEEGREARVRLNNAPQPGNQGSGSSVAGWVAFALLLIAVLAALGALYLKKRGKKTEDNEVEVRSEENQELLSKENTTKVAHPTDLSTTIKQHYVNVTLETTENPYLRVKDRILRDAHVDFPDGPKVTCLTAIKGTPGFSSGQHYWEVSLGKPEVGLKQSWWVGVTSATVFPQEFDFSPTAPNSFWFLSSSPDRADHLQFSTEPKVLLPVCDRPQTLGVFLDYDSGELSFYNVEHNSLIGSFTATFTGEVFPIFNPGKGDKAAMEILQGKTEQVQEQGQSGDGGNSVDSPTQKAES